MTDFSLEKNAWQRHLPFYGFDEAGYGTAAGSMWIAAVSFYCLTKEEDLAGVRDSKKTTEHEREILAAKIRSLADWKVWEVTSAEIDAGNPYHLRYTTVLPWINSQVAGVTCFDGNKSLDTKIHEDTFCVKGDSVSLSIAAASILAKEAKDLECERLEAAYPGWGFERHAGYLSTEHTKKIETLGSLPIHRKKYIRNVKQKDGT